MNEFSSPGMRRRRLLQAGMAATMPGTLAAAHAATPPWPQKPLRLIVGFPAGTSPDFLARTVSEGLSQALGQPVIVDNKPGATGTIGVDMVAKSSDGHTFGLTGNGPLTTAKALNPKLPFDVARDLRPISLLASSPFVLVSAMELPADLKSVITYAREQGDKLSYGSIGLGSGSHLGMELLKTLTGIKPVHIPFPGFPQVANAMVGNQIALSFFVPSVAVPLAQAGRLRILAVTTAARSSILPDVPPIATALSLPKVDFAGWNGIFGPASMPEAHADRLAEAIGRIARSPEVRQRLFDQGWQSLGTSPEGLSRRIKDDTALWADIVRVSGARGE